MRYCLSREKIAEIPVFFQVGCPFVLLDEGNIDLVPGQEMLHAPDLLLIPKSSGIPADDLGQDFLPFLWAILSIVTGLIVG